MNCVLNAFRQSAQMSYNIHVQGSLNLS